MMGTSDRRPYLTATALNQALLDEMADNLDFGLQMIADIEAPAPITTIRASDRNKYVGTVFYEAICTFPVIKRTLGEWLSPEIEFSTLELPLSNVDGRFNPYLQGGASFTGWIGKQVTVKLGIRDSSSTYLDIYRGTVTDIGGMTRDRSIMRVRTRDLFDKFNQDFPTTALTQNTWPDLEDSLAGTVLPVAYGNWTVSPLQRGKDSTGADIGETASVPAFVVNGAKASVLTGVDNVRLLITENNNASFDTTQVWMQRGSVFGLIPGANITAVSGNRDFEIIQAFTFDGAPYVYQSGDLVWCRITGKSLPGYDYNAIEQAKDILTTFAGAVSGDFDATWNYYRDKATPAESAVANFNTRIWVQDPQSVIVYVLSLLEQVRLEMFQSKDLKLSLSALHLDEFEATPAYTVKQWDIKADTLQPSLDDRNIWNRARGSYAFDPSIKGEVRETPIYRNSAAITQAGKEISKRVTFPNLYNEADVALNLKEMLKLATGYPEFINVVLSQRASLLDIGDFVCINVDMGSIVYQNVPCMIRDLGHDPEGYSVPVKLWSFQMTPFTGWTPGYAGTVGGSTATITEET